MPRKDLSVLEKVTLLDKLKAYPPNTPLRTLAESLNIPKSTLGKLKRTESQLRSQLSSLGTGPGAQTQKRRREGKDPEVDEALHKWFSAVNDPASPVTGPLLKKKAVELAKDLGHEDFVATDGWLSRWKSRHGVKFKKPQDEASTSFVDASTSYVDTSTGYDDASTGFVGVSTGYVGTSTGYLGTGTGYFEASTDFVGASTGQIGTSSDHVGVSTDRVEGSNYHVQAEKWRSEKLPELLVQFSAENIYNCDEFGLLYRATPDGDLCFRKENLVGSREAMERLTVLCCVNMTGMVKKKLLLIGKDTNPRCFKYVNRDQLPVEYLADPNAWITSSTFTDWLIKWDVELQRSSRFILLLLDDCSAHPKNVPLKNIHLEFFPPNTSLVFQPLDMGIIEDVKTKYKSKVADFVLEHREDGKIDPNSTAKEISQIMNLLVAISFLSDSWKSVTPTTIKACFASAGLKTGSEDDAMLVESCKDVKSTLEIRVQNHDEFQNLDLSVPCYEEMQIEDVEGSALNRIKEEAVSEGEDDEAEDRPVEVREARDCVDVLRRFFLQEGYENSPVEALNACSAFIREVSMKKQKPPYA